MVANRTICIDTRMLGEATGVASYTRAVLEALDAAGVAPLRLADANGPGFGGRQGGAARAVRGLSVVVPHAVALDLAGDRLIAPDLFRRAQAHFGLHRRVLRLRTSLPPGTVHWMYPVPASIDGWRNVYTLHDAIPLASPGLTPTDGGALRARVAAIAGGAAGFVTVSDHARGQIVNAFGIARERIVSCGLATSGMTAGARPAVLAQGGYFIVYGSTEARKNIERTVAAWRASGTARRLAIVAADVADPAALHARLGGGERLVVLPRLDRPALLATVAGARAVLFASLAEGFGLPIIEAMALGVPVLTSSAGVRGGACAETAGGAALLVDPDDTDAMAAAIARLADDDRLCERLIEAGRARARDFAPAAFGQRLLDAYRRFGLSG